MSETDYSFEPEANDVLIEVDELVENPDIDIGEYDSSEEESVTGSLGGLQFDVIDSDSPTVYTTIDDVTPADYTCGTPGELPTPSTALVDADLPLNKIITVVTTNVEQIVEVNEDLIQFISDNNARVYAVLNDGTRVQCELSDVFDPEKAHAQVFVNQGLIIANSLKQHFWYDSNGAHVTDDEQDDWNEEYNKTGHGDLANPSLNRPWHNILINSYGLLIRKGLIWLSQHSVGSVLFYDGTGNTLNNVVAGFSTDGVQIGKLTEKHMIIDDDGFTAYDENGDIAPITAYLSGSYIEDSTITGSKIASSTIENSNIKDSTITGSKIASSTIENSNIKDGTITGGKIIGSTLTGIPQAAIVNLSTDYAHIDDLTAATGRITTLETNTADIGTLRANSAKIANLTAQQLSAAVGYIADLTAGNITTTDLIADHGTIGSLDVNYAQVNMANVNNAWIENGTVKNGAISDAMINSVSANKLTAGTIDASNITVTNLNANNITTGTINGQRIGTGSLSLDKLSEDVYTETEVDNLLATMQSEIDGAIETWTGTAVPTLNNTPASGWSTNADKDKHVGDVYFVINSQSQQNGYNYRFTKSGNTYSWQLIKDTDITNALSRLSTAEGKITTFDSDITTLKTDTGTLKTKTQSLETSLGDKVDVTTFNEVSDTVDQHSQSITQMSQTLSNKADGSIVTALTTKVNTVSDTVDGHTQTIGSVQTTQTQMQGKLDKTIVETIQLWYSKSSTDAPGKPTSQVTSTSTAGNAWRTVVPAYNASYPNYFYCYQWKYTDGTYGWSSVTRDIAMGESQERARTAITNAAAADTKAGNAASAAATAQSTANTAASDASTAKTDAASAVSTANSAATDASTALSAANTANTNASNAVSTANTANTNASAAVSTANTAAADASTAKTNASTAVSTANTAKATADKNVKSTLQLWYTKANDTAPSKPTSKVTSNSVSGNAWRVVVPTYSASYPYYFYCYQYELADGTCTWSDVVYDRATTENQSNSRSAVANVSTLTTKTNTISDTVDGHTSQLSSITNTQTSIQGSAVKSTVQLWFTKANTTAPNKPTAHVTTNNASAANAWNLAVPTYNASYPNYYYCYEYEYLNGTYGWSAVTRDIATGEAQSTARTAASDASTAKTNASSAVSTANTANTNASNAVSTANAANTNASNAVSTANTAASDASTAKTNAATAVSTANTANTNASSAVTTANTAKSTADKNMRESQQLWFTKANSTAPGKPTSKVTSTATTGNAWTTKVPTYNASYKYYFYCMQYIAADGTVTWSDVIYDQATTEAQSVARAASADLTEFHQEYATFKQTTQNFESTVGETYATKTEMAESVKQHDSDTESPLVVGDNAATAPLRSYEGMGHAEQFTTTGKNLCFRNTSGSRTSGGITYSYNADGTYYTTGGTPSNYTLADENRITGLALPLAAGTYTASCGGVSGLYLWIVKKDNDAWTTLITAVHHKIVYTFTLDTETQVGITLSALTDEAVGSGTAYIQVEAGSTATAYEPYTGGAPSPSPDYPQEIKVVRGRNLIDESKSTVGYRLGASGQLIPIANCATSDFIEVEAGGAYYVTNGMGSAIGRVAAFYDTSKAFVSAAFFNNSVVASGVITAPLNATYVRVDYLMPTHANYVGPMQLEEGSTATPYVPYGHVGLEVQGRNLIDPSTFIAAGGGPDVIDSDGYFSDSTPTSDTRQWGYGNRNFTATLDAGTYTISFGVRKASTYSWDGYRVYASDGTLLVQKDANPPTFASATFTLIQRTTIGILVKIHEGIYACMLELGSTPHEYQPYYHETRAIPLPSRGWVAGVSDDTADVLTLDSAGKVEWELNDAEVVLDGSEQWQAYNIYGYSCPAAGLIPNCKYAATGNTPVMSNLYQNRTPTWTDSSFGIENRSIWVGDRNSARFGSLAGFKTFLASTNLTILYPLATPIIEERGYIDMPQVSEGYTISIPELEDSGISWWCKASESMANATTAIEKRVATAETSITQTKEQILLKANSSDVYTKTQTDGLISTEVTNRNAAIQLASNSITSTVEKSYSKQQSRGIQLVTNGNGFMGDNTNWPKLTFDGAKTNGLPGSFTKNIIDDTVWSDEFIPIDPSKEYLFEFDAMSADGTARIYSMLAMFDVDKKVITAPNIMYFPNTLTTLAADLNPGDTTVKLTSATNWANTSYNYQRSLIFWDYTNTKGYTYPEETYSRNVYTSVYTNDNSVNKATGVITLKTAWTGPKKLAGTKVSQNTSGMQHVYADTNALIPNEWTHYKFVYSGIDTTKNGNDDTDITKRTGKFRQGTAFIKPGFLWNVGHSLSAPQGQLWVTNISVKENVATSTEVEAVNTVVQQTANNVLIKATQSDTTAAQGGQHLIQSLINVAPSGVKIDTAKLNITGDAVFSAINNDTGTTKISGGKIDATSITLGQSQVKNYVSIRATTINYSANTATLEATLYVGGVAKTTGVTYVWMKDGTAISGATSRNYSVPASSGLNHAYSCKCTATV